MKKILLSGLTAVALSLLFLFAYVKTAGLAIYRISYLLGRILQIVWPIALLLGIICWILFAVILKKTISAANAAKKPEAEQKQPVQTPPEQQSAEKMPQDTVQEKTCRKCGRILTPGQKFCPMCGTPVDMEVE